MWRSFKTNKMDHWFLQGDYTPIPTDVPMMLMGLMLAFCCGHAIAWVYMFTHSGLSYSRSFVNSLVVIPTIVSMVMLVLSNNLVTAFGLMAVFAMYACGSPCKNRATAQCSHTRWFSYSSRAVTHTT